jgi:hypothetical protein
MPVPGSRAERTSKLFLQAAAMTLAALLLAGCAGQAPAPLPSPAQAPVDPEQPARAAEARGDFTAAAQAWQALAGRESTELQLFRDDRSRRVELQRERFFPMLR